MKPFLRPTDRGRLAPVGWVSEPVGRWGGKEVDVVYDPRRHQVLLVRDQIDDTTRTAVAGTGYRRMAVEGSQEMWVRDRADVTQHRLDHLERGHSQERVPDVVRVL